jgi:hypothetical protein
VQTMNSAMCPTHSFSKISLVISRHAYVFILWENMYNDVEVQ